MAPKGKQDVEAHGAGVNIPGGGTFPAITALHTSFDPWLLSVGLVYRFGAAEPLVAKY